ncbi:MAG: hypothetical protein M1457_07425 [bacterium]|nr:hypothetical protein [bacterium]
MASIIGLFAGLFLFSVQQMYNDNRRKATYDETKQIGTAFEFAHQDLGFYPRLDLLSLPISLALPPDTAGVSQMRPAFDYYGLLTTTSPELRVVLKKWGGPYTQNSEARGTSAQGRHGNVLMRIPDNESTSFKEAGGQNGSIVVWPCDTWGNPYVLYQVTASPDSRSATNPLGLRLVKRPGEIANYLNAVVSYGPNGMPGGGLPGTPTQTDAGYAAAYLKPAMLYVKGDLLGNQAEYTLKIMNPNTVTVTAMLGTDDSFNSMLAKSIHADSDHGGTWTPPPGEIGILDNGSDDIFWKF